MTNTTPADLSLCHKAPTKLVGGRGDFRDNDIAVTMHYECTECGEPCDLYVEHPIDPAVPDELNKTILHTKLTQLGIDYGYFWTNTLEQEPPEDCANRNAYTSQLFALFTQYQHLQYNKDEKELQLCNCDGHWHVECPDGITRYISDESLEEYGRQARLDELNKVIGQPGVHSEQEIRYFESRRAQLTPPPTNGEETAA